MTRYYCQIINAPTPANASFEITTDRLIFRLTDINMEFSCTMNHVRVRHENTYREEPAIGVGCSLAGHYWSAQVSLEDGEAIAKLIENRARA